MFKNIKLLNAAIAAILLLLYAPHKTMASHFAAADISAAYVGTGVDPCSGIRDNKYEVTLDLYKACEAGNADLSATETITVRSTTGGFTQTFAVPVLQIDTLDELCDTYKPQNSCRVPANQHLPAFVRHRYVLSITLPSTQPDWTFSWRSGNRNANIVNLQAPSTRSMYVEAGLDNTTRNNSTPRYQVPPIPYLCTNQAANFLNGPYDVDGDSIDVTNVQPLDDVGVPVPYATLAYPYSLTDPVASAATNPYTVNRYTGTATFTPTTQGYFVVAFRCEEYDRATGKRVGYISRDAQMSVVPCNAPPPSVDATPITINNGTFVNKSLLVCPGSNLNFTVNSNSANATSQL